MFSYMSKKVTAAKKKGEVKANAVIADPNVIDNTKSLGPQISSLFNDPQTSDCAFVVGKDDARCVIYAHKILVGAWSEPLKRLLAGGTSTEKKNEKEGKGEAATSTIEQAEIKVDAELLTKLRITTTTCVVVLPDRDPQLFTSFLKFFYTGRIPLSNLDVGRVLSLATDYKVSSLLDACVQYMTDSMAVDTVCRLAILAQQISNKELGGRYLKYMYLNAKRVLQSPGFLELPFDLLLALLTSDQFGASEIDVFNGVVAWLGVKTDRVTGAPVDRSDKTKILLSQIRFGQMQLKELMKEVRPTGLVPDETIWRLVDILADPAAISAADAKEFNMKKREPPATYLPATSRFEDNTGIIYWLGTNEGKSTNYRNPIPADIKITMSSTAGTNTTKLGDRNLAGTAVENAYGREPNPWIDFEFKKHRIRLERWFMAQDHDHYIRNWRVQGSNDGSTWTTIHEYVNDTSLGEGHRHSFFTVDENPTFFKRIRWYITGPSHNAQPNFDITQIELFGWVLKEGQDL